MFATGVPLSAHSARLSESSSPSAGKVVWTVALRELTEQLMSLRFLLIALLVLGLTPPRRDSSAVINRSLPSLALLIGAVAVFVLAGFLAFSRYDVR
ncbi:MAG: hypothetical protein ABSH28_09920 [Acidobacteriota bacterium]|jgi:hypothetical protein